MWKKIILIYFLSLFIGLSALAQDEPEPLEMWVKLSPEIRLNFEDFPLEIRWRPDDHIFMPEKYLPTGNQARTDLMIGVNLWKFKLFSYSKYDQSDAFWTGARLDFNFSMFNKKVLCNIQERYFWGLNDESEDHYYLVQYIRYRMSKSGAVGVLSYGKWDPTRDFEKGYWFIGPSIQIVDKSGLGIQLAFTKEVFHEPVYMTFVRIGYKLMLKNQSRIITIEDEDY